MKKFSILSIIEDVESLNYLIKSINTQSYPNIEIVLIMKTGIKIESPFDCVLLTSDSEDFMENFRLLVENATGDYFMFMDEVDYFYDETSVSQIVDLIEQKDSDLLVTTYVTLQDQKLLFHHYGDDVEVVDVCDNNLPIFMNIYAEFKKFSGMVFKKAAFDFDEKGKLEILSRCLTKAKNLIFDKHVYYVISAAVNNVDADIENVRFPLPQLVPLVQNDEALSKDNISIALCVDEGYAPYISTLLYSINKYHNSQVNIYIIYEDLGPEVLENICKLDKHLQNVQINLVKIPTYRLQFLDNIKVNFSGLAKSIYYRFLIPDLLAHLDKIIYLDIDTLVCEDLSELWQMPFDGTYIIGSVDLPIANKEDMWGYRLFGEDCKKYINSGVMVLNLAAMRQNHLIEKWIRYTMDNAKYLKYDDQDVVNLFFYKAIKLVDSKYNYLVVNPKYEFENQNEISLVHYVSRYKPWKNNFDDENRLQVLINRYRIQKFEINHLMDTKPRIKVIIDIGGNEFEQKRKIYSILIQRYANIEIFALVQNDISNYLQQLEKEFKWLHLVKIQNDKIYHLKEILENSVDTYVYLLGGKNFFNDDTSLYNLYNYAYDKNADLVVSSYLRLQNGIFYFVEGDSSYNDITAETLNDYQENEFSILNNLEGVLLRESLLYEELKNNDKLAESQYMINILNNSTNKFFFNSNGWVKVVD